jgi:hypothetical protein
VLNGNKDNTFLNKRDIKETNVRKLEEDVITQNEIATSNILEVLFFSLKVEIRKDISLLFVSNIKQ